ncbi:glycine receptor subunit alpha-4-like [Oratosquilla oratoria]|uniref:glycine receptor subunit alpha-4-like n=1 Tax=Oratosquilla oratoria TaxID=337810 RepID=UPI003F7755F7
MAWPGSGHSTTTPAAAAASGSRPLAVRCRWWAPSSTPLHLPLHFHLHIIIIIIIIIMGCVGATTHGGLDVGAFQRTSSSGQGPRRPPPPPPPPPIPFEWSSSELSKLDELLLPPYDRRQTPNDALGSATRVLIEMYIRSFGSVNPIQMDYSVDLYLRQRWVESRFVNNSLTRPLDLNDPMLVKWLWKPEVYFPNAKDGDFQYVTVPNVMLRIHPDGTILYNLRLKLTFSCMMDLATYPLDKQTCFIELASFSKTTRELELHWYSSAPIKMYEHLKLPQYQINKVNVSTCTQSFHIGNYSCLQAAFYLQRNVGYHLVQSYLPTTLIVMVSWVSFWLDVDAIPSRVTLGVTTLLTICSESTGIRDKMPPVSYVKALDIWMGACTGFVFLALLEFTMVNYLARHRRRFLFWSRDGGQSAAAGYGYGAAAAAAAVLGLEDSCHTISVINPKETSPLPPECLKKRRRWSASTGSLEAEEPRARMGAGAARWSCLPGFWHHEVVVAKKLDRSCRFVFPLLFICFNFIYWGYYKLAD